MTVPYLSAVVPVYQLFTNSGNPAVGYLLFTYQAQTSTPQATWIDGAGISQNTNPIITDSNGRITMFFQQGFNYKLSLSPPGDLTNTSPIWTVDNVNSLGLSSLFDPNGVLVFKALAGSGTPVNYITATNASSGNSPQLSSSGSDSNSSLGLTGKGTGGIQLVNDSSILDSSGNPYLKVQKAGSSVNSLVLKNAATTTNPGLIASGSDTNISLDLVPKGTGGLNIYPVGASYGTNIAPLGAGLTGNRTIVLPDTNILQHLVQYVKNTNATYTSGTGTIAFTDTVPVLSGGNDPSLNLTIVPKNVNNLLRIHAIVYVSFGSGSNSSILALFQDSTTNALNTTTSNYSDFDTFVQICILDFWMTAGTTSSTTFKFRYGSPSGTSYLNGNSSGRLFGGTLTSMSEVFEYSP